MKRFIHFARKHRQLKSKIKSLKASLINKNYLKYEKLKAQINTLLHFADIKMTKELILLGLAITTLQAKSQSIQLNMPTIMDTNSNYFPFDFIGIDSTIPPTYPPTFQLVNGVATTARFIDVDNDGDLDAFYFADNKGCQYGNFACNGSFLPGFNRLIYQENTSNNNTLFADPQLILSLPSNGASFYADTISFEIADFDSDGDYDILLLNRPVFQIFENSSGLNNKFDLSYAFNIGQTDAFYTDLIDIDNDGDEDIISTITDINKISFKYLENKGTNELFPFDTIPKHLDIHLSIDTLVRSRFATAEFADMDLDGNLDILFQGFFKEDDLNDPYYYTEEKRLYYFKNQSTTSGFTFNSVGEALLERDVRTEYTSVTHTFFNNGDIDNDGDVDIIENWSEKFVQCGYCGYTSKMRAVLYHENVSEIPTSILTKANIEFEIFPNPVSESAILKFRNINHQKATVNIYNSLGKLVTEGITFSNSFTIEKGRLANGIYTFTLAVDDQIGSGQLIFTH